MSLLRAFQKVLSGDPVVDSDLLGAAKTMGSIAGVIQTYSTEESQAFLSRLLMPWAIRVAQLAPSRWVLPARVAPVCALEQQGRLCAAFAVGACHICSRPICMTHALVSANADLVCWACMKVAAQHAPKWQATKPELGQKGAESGSDWAYEMLGIERGATKAQIKAAFKKRIARFHPDTLPQGTDPKPNGDLVRMIKRAYDVVLKETGAAEARP